MQTHWHGERFDRIGSIENARPRWLLRLLYGMRPSCFPNQRSTSTVTVSPGANTREGIDMLRQGNLT